MKIGIYDPYFDTQGGGERYILSIAEYYLNRGDQVDLFWSGDKNLVSKAISRFSLNLDKLNLVPDIFNQHPSKTDMVDNLDNLKVFSQKTSQNPLSKITYLKTIYQQTKKYDAIFFLSDGSLPFLFARKNIIHLQVPFNFSQSIPTKILNYFKKLNYSSFIVNSQFTKRFVDNCYLINSTVIYPPVDISKFKTNSNKQNIILSVGRFDNLLNAKKQDILISAFKQLLSQSLAKDFKLVLAGGSHDQENQNQYLNHLKHQAKDLPIEFIINPDFNSLVDLYSKSKFYWHAAGYNVDENITPQYTEHFGITVVEAMASGLVPLAVAKGGLVEIVKDNQNGFLWNTIDDLVAKTNLLIGNPNLVSTLSVQALIDAKNYTKENFFTKLSNLL